MVYPVAVKKRTTSVLQYRYHGWTYLLDGSLRGVPQFSKVKLFDKKDFGLEAIDIEVRQDIDFIRFMNKFIPIDKLLKGIPKRIAPIALSSFFAFVMSPMLSTAIGKFM